MVRDLIRDGFEEGGVVSGVHAEFPEHDACEVLFEGVADFSAEDFGVVEVEAAGLVLCGGGILPRW